MISFNLYTILGILLLIALPIVIFDNYKDYWDDVYHNKPVKTGWIVFLFFCLLIVLYTYFSGNYDDEKVSVPGVLTELHGFLFDLLIVGVLLVFIDHKRESRRKKERYKEGIDDFRHWKSAEASHRILGSFKRLQGEKEKNIDLSYCNFIGTTIIDFSFGDANLNSSKFVKSTLIDIKLKNKFLKYPTFLNTEISRVNFEYEELFQATFKGRKTVLYYIGFPRSSILAGCVFDGVTFLHVDFSDTIIKSCRFLNIPNMNGVFFNNAFLLNTLFIDTSFTYNIHFTGATICNCEFKNVEGLTYDILSKAKSVYRCKLDETLLQEIKEKKPELLDKPEDYIE